MMITLNGDPFELAAPSTVSQLLARLEIDARRVAVEHNLVVLKRAAFDSTEIREAIRSRSSTSSAADRAFEVDRTSRRTRSARSLRRASDESRVTWGCGPN